MFPLKDAGSILSLPLLASGGCWQPLGTSALWQHHLSAFILMWPSSFCLCVSKLLITMAPVTGWKAHPTQYDLILTTSAKISFPNPVRSHRLGLEHNFGKTQPVPARVWPRQAAFTVSSHYTVLQLSGRGSVPKLMEAFRGQLIITFLHAQHSACQPKNLHRLLTE